MKTMIASKDDCLEHAAELIRGLLADKPNAAIALDAGEDCLALYDKLASDCAEGKLSLSKAHFFSVSEFAGLSAASPESVRNRLMFFLEKTDAREENCSFLTEENAGCFDELIATAGGLDLAVLGIGLNARIGLNEPATPFASLTHRQKLAPATRRELADRFGDEEKVPEYGFTMGIKTLIGARTILLVAAGEEKAKPVFDMLYGRDDSVIPAAFLQLSSNVTICLDEKAGARL